MNGRHDDINIDTQGVTAMLEAVGLRNEPNIAGQRSLDGTTANRQDGTTAPEPSGATAPEPSSRTASEPRGQTAVRPSKYTVLLNEQDALAFDQLAYEMRAIAGRRVEKSEIMRAMIHLASIDTTVNKILGRSLDRRRQASPSPRATEGQQDTAPSNAQTEPSGLGQTQAHER